MQKALFFDSPYRQKISPLEIQCQLMLVFGDGVSRPHNSEKRCREFRSRLASNLKISAKQIKNM